MNCKTKSFMTKKKAFTLVELLIVIAIIGILFIVLVSKVDFATDKAKATGVQTDFRSFQSAFESASKENAGFNTFGWDTGDVKRTDFHTVLAGYTYDNEEKDRGDKVRNSYDEGDINLNGICDTGETFTGRKVYTEVWTEIYTLVKPGTTFNAAGYDKDAIFALENAINKNLDPKLHITIDAKTGIITMANGAQDPWNTQYHGAYISAEDGMDRGAIVMYSNGANQKFGSEHDIANGVPTVIVPGNNKQGADDYSLVVCYTYTNGYGEIGALTTGFSNNQTFFASNSAGGNFDIGDGDDGGNPSVPSNIVYEMSTGDIVMSEMKPLVFRSLADFSKFKEFRVNNNVVESKYYTVESGSTIVTLGTDYLQQLNNGIYSVEIVSSDGKASCTLTKNIVIVEEVKTLEPGLYDENDNLIMDWNSLVSNYGFDVESDCMEGWGDLFPTENCTKILKENFSSYSKIHLVLPDSVTRLGEFTFSESANLYKLTLGANFEEIGFKALHMCPQLSKINVSPDNNYLYSKNDCVIVKDTQTLIFGLNGNIPSGVKVIGDSAFMHGYITNVIIPNSVTTIEMDAFSSSNIKNVVMGNNVETIESYAFACTKIASIQIPASMKFIETLAFDSCTLLYEVYNKSNLDIVAGADTYGSVAKYAKTVYNNDNSTSLMQIGDFLFYVDGGVYKLIRYDGNGNNIVLPVLNGGQSYSIGEDVFAGQNNLISLHIPSYVTSIGNGAFRSCSNLSYITFESGLTSIGDESFSYCTSLERIVLPNSLSSIGRQAFSGCSSLKTIELNDGLQSIGKNAFFGCNAIQTLYIPLSVTSVGDQIFNWNTTVVIKCAATSKPSQWSGVWNHTYTDTLSVIWNASR